MCACECVFACVYVVDLIFVNEELEFEEGKTVTTHTHIHTHANTHTTREKERVCKSFRGETRRRTDTQRHTDIRHTHTCTHTPDVISAISMNQHTSMYTCNVSSSMLYMYVYKLFFRCIHTPLRKNSISHTHRHRCVRISSKYVRYIYICIYVYILIFS